MFALCKVELLFILHAHPHHHLFSAWMIQCMVESHKSKRVRVYFCLLGDCNILNKDVPSKAIVKWHMSRDGEDAVVMYCRTHLCLCLPHLTPSQINFMWQAWLHMFVFLFPPASPPLQPSTPHRHTHELKQLPWHWPSVVIIYSLFTHSCWWHFSNTGIVHCVWECGRQRDRKRYRGRVGLTEFE